MLSLGKKYDSSKALSTERRLTIDSPAHGELNILVKPSSRRRTIAIKVAKAEISILCPTATPTDYLETLVRRKYSWIQSKLQQQLSRQQDCQQAPALLAADSQIGLLGRNYRLAISRGRHKALLIEGDQLIGQLPKAYDDQSKLKQKLSDWYKSQGRHYLGQRCQYFAALVGASPTKITVKTYRARWGSCNQRGELQFNWKILLAPSEVCDYVVVHELCHLLHHNHSKAFWREVERVMPRYRQYVAWLKDNGWRLEL